MSAGRRPATPPKIPNARYLSYLGSGGFADVYLYDQQVPHREVAIKVLRRGVTEQQKLAFRAEANLMARMSSHPSVVSVHGAGETEDGRMYLIMEYCPPPHLGKLLRMRPLPVTFALEVGIQIAGAVETLHRAGIVHRDIKPSNILMTPYQHPVLTDFGIATRMGDTTQAEGFSVPWAPPEQATGEGEAAPAVDVYSLAATIYTLVAGRAPFEIVDGDNSEIAVINRVLRSPLPKTGRTDAPDELERVLATAMAKDPKQRYQSVREFATALQFIQAEQLHQRPTDMNVQGEGEEWQESSAIDEDATRQAVRTISPIDDENTRDVPRRVGRHSIEVDRGAGVVFAVDSADVASAGRRHSYYGAPAGDDEPEAAPPPEAFGAKGKFAAFLRKPVARFSIAAVVVLIVALSVVYFMNRGKGETIKPSPSASETTKMDPGAEQPQGVTKLKGTVKNGRVTFTWENPDPHDGDMYLYKAPFAAGEGKVEATEKTSVTVAARPVETCITVQVRRVGVSNESKAVSACVVTSGQ